MHLPLLVRTIYYQLGVISNLTEEGEGLHFIRCTPSEESKSLSQRDTYLSVGNQPENHQAVVWDIYGHFVWDISIFFYFMNDFQNTSTKNLFLWTYLPKKDFYKKIQTFYHTSLK